MKNFNTGPTWTLPEERASGRISIKGAHESRMATMCSTCCGDPTVKVPPGLIFKGQGKLSTVHKTQLSKMATDSGAKYCFQENAWMDTDRLLW